MGMGVLVDVPETNSRCSNSVNLDVQDFDLSLSAVLIESFRPLRYAEEGWPDDVAAGLLPTLLLLLSQSTYVVQKERFVAFIYRSCGVRILFHVVINTLTFRHRASSI